MPSRGMERTGRTPPPPPPAAAATDMKARHQYCHLASPSSRPAKDPTSMQACIDRAWMHDGSLASLHAHVLVHAWPALALDVVGRRHSSILQEHSIHSSILTPWIEIPAAAMHGRMCSCMLSLLLLYARRSNLHAAKWSTSVKRASLQHIINIIWPII
jgi:hypothetical protein